MEFLLGILVILAAFGGVIYLLAEWPRTLLCGVILLVLIVSCQRADAADCFKATPLDCTASVPSLPQGAMVERGADSVPLGTTGGGGATGWGYVLALAFLALAAAVVRLQRRNGDLLELVHKLEEQKPNPFAVADIAHMVPDVDDEAHKRYLHIEFTSLAGMCDFHSWLYNHRNKLKRDGWPAVMS